ncbi:MAG: hypothetical protein ACI8V4_003618, partial [Ilumatobacter sp.]
SDIAGRIGTDVGVDHRRVTVPAAMWLRPTRARLST